MPHLVVLEIKSMYKATVTIGHEEIVKSSLLKILGAVGSRSNGFKVQGVENGSLCSSFAIVDANLGKDGSYAISRSNRGDCHPKTGIRLQQLHIALLDAMQNKGWKLMNYIVDTGRATREWTFETS